MTTKGNSSASVDYLQAIEEAVKGGPAGKRRRYSVDFIKMVVSAILSGIPKAHIQKKSKLSSSTLHRWYLEWEPKLRKKRIYKSPLKMPTDPDIQTLMVLRPENSSPSPESSIATIKITVGEVSITVSGRTIG